MSYKITKQMENGFCALVSLSDKPEINVVQHETVGYVLLEPHKMKHNVFKIIVEKNTDWFFGAVKVYNNPKLFGEYLFSGDVNAMLLASEKQYGMICCKPGIIK